MIYAQSPQVTSWLFALLLGVCISTVGLWKQQAKRRNSRVYKYTPLENDQIRLMILHGGERHERIVFDLSTLRLFLRPDYEAVSYTWGDPKLTEHVFLSSGQSITVTTNLIEALRRLRCTDKSRVLWVDAVCINQEDSDERASQVLLMGEVYSWTSKVLIWLGEEENNEGYQCLKLLDDLDAIFTDYNQIYHISGSSPDTGKESRLHEQVLRLNIHPLVLLFQRPWFRRVWIVQEIVKAREGVVIWGRTTIPWQYMTKVLPYVTIQRDEVMELSYWYRSIQVVRREAPNFRAGNSKWDIVYLIWLMSRFDCTDPRDKIFSVLSIVSTKIRPNYRSNLTEVTKDLVKQCAKDQLGLKILSLAGLSYQSETANIPSWVPEIGYRYPELMMFVYESFNAANTPKDISERRENMKQARIEIHDDCLSISAQIIDTIVDLSLPQDSSYLDGASLDRGITASMLKSAVDVASKALWPFNESKFKSFLLSLGADSYSVHFNIQKLEKDMKVAEKFFASNIASDNRGDWLLQNFYSWPGALHCVQEHLSNRCFGLTNAGCFTLLPSKTRQGDNIAVIRGSPVPHVIRRTRDTSFLLIGECFVQGAMHGEALRDELFEWSRITLI